MIGTTGLGVRSSNPGASDTHITTIWRSTIVGNDPQGADRQGQDQAAAETDKRRQESERNRTGIGPADADEMGVRRGLIDPSVCV